MEINVTQEDIDVADLLKNTSSQNAECRCPIALALRRIDSEARASYGSLRFNGLKIQTPFDAYCFMLDWDSSKPVKPFSFVAEEEEV